MKKKQSSVFFYKKVVKIPMYGGNFIIVFSNDSSRVEKLVNVREGSLLELYAYTFHNFLHKGYESYCVVLNFWNPLARITIGTIVHEVVHASNRVLNDRNVIPDFENDETTAYLAGWMGDQIQDFMVKCGLAQ